jgi:accessory gene regulator B
MTRNLAGETVEKLIELGTVKENEKELYMYGLEQGFFSIANLITTVTIGLIFSIPWETVIFMASYLPLRSFAGGYHAKTHLQCYFFSIVLTIVVVSMIRFIDWSNFAISILAIVSGFIIYTLAPIGDSNKPLDKIEVVRYKNRTTFLLIIELMLVFSLINSVLRIVSVCVVVALLALSVMLSLGKLYIREQ